MKIRPVLRALLCSACLATGVTGRADPAPAPAAAPPELTIVIVDSLAGPRHSFADWHRLARVFTDVFEARKWPVKITSELFGAGAPEHPVELRIFFQGIRHDTPDDLTFRAWLTLSDHGAKYDFGIISFRYYPRAAELMDDRLDHAIHGAALLAADKIEAKIFPKAAPAKP